jgi:hypothetical protein
VRVAEVTGGELRPQPQAVFVKRPTAAPRARDIWALLAVAALLLFPLDVALRRLVIEREHLALFSEALARLAWWRRAPVLVESAPLGRLLQRKQETVQTLEQERPAVTMAPGRPPVSSATPSPPRPKATPAPGDAGDRMKRLLEAKRRARPS